MTLTLGANDIDFAGWLTKCYDAGYFLGPDHSFVPPACNNSDNTTAVSNLLTDAKSNLHKVLQEIHDRGVANGKIPHVYVTGYYNPFPATYTTCSDIVTSIPSAGLTQDEILWLQGKSDSLNSNISDEASKFSNVSYVDISNVMNGHQFCSSDPWVYGASISVQSGQLHSPAPYHPTPAGQRAIYQAIKSAMFASNDFETGDLSQWNSQSSTPPTICSSSTTPSCTPSSGSYGVDFTSANQTGGAALTRSVSGTDPTADMSGSFNVRSATTNASLFYFQTGSGGAMFHVYLDHSTGKVGIRTDSGTATTYPGCNQALPTSYPWSGYHKVEARTVVASSGNSVIQLWVDGQPVTLSGADGSCGTSDDRATLSASIGNTNVGKLILGDTASNRTFEFWADDVTASTSTAGTVTGTVTRLDGTTGLSGATVGISGQLATTTDSSGNYTLTGVPTGTDQTVTSSLSGYLGASTTVNLSANGSAPHSFSLTKVIFSDNLESGGLSNWTTNTNLTACTSSVSGCPHAGTYGAEATASGTTAAYAKKVLSSSASEVYFRTYVYVASQGSNNVSLLQLANSSGSLIAHVFLNSSHQVGIRNDSAGTTTQSTTALSTGAWHSLEFHAKINSALSATDVFLDGTAIVSLTNTSANLGTNNVAAVWLGENQTGRTYDVLFDDAVVQDGYVGL